MGGGFIEGYVASAKRKDLCNFGSEKLIACHNPNKIMKNLLLSSSLKAFLMCFLGTSIAYTTFAKPSGRCHRSAVFAGKDTPIDLPEFQNAEEYLEYMEAVSSLPKGFAAGTADGTFISQEAPNLGRLGIRGTVIQLTEGPTDSWAACFTSNKVPSIVLLSEF